MNPGLFRHRVEIQEHTEIRGADGEIVREWKTVNRWWCSLDPLSGQELQYAQQVHAQAKVRIRMRYCKGLTTKHRIKWGERYYNILDARCFNELLEIHELMCVEVV